MLTIFNRQELTVTFSLKELNRIQNILAENKLEYRVKSCLKGGNESGADAGIYNICS